MSTAPRVAVGIPVYNGEKHVALAIESVLNQSYKDLVLIISDNASTDGTERICREFAARDPRVIYHRNEKNLGASPNYNKVFALSHPDTEYFQWLAHDDLLAPQYIEKCLAAMDAAPKSAVLSFPKRQWISHEEGKPIGQPNQSPKSATIEPAPGEALDWEHRDDWHNISYAKLIRQHSSWNPMFAFALTRSSAIRAIPGLPAFYAGDAIMISEFRLQGQFVYVPEVLFYERLHPWTGWTGRKNRQEESFWWDTRGVALHESKRSRRWALYREYFRAINRSPIPFYRKLPRYLDVSLRMTEGALRQLGARVRSIFAKPSQPVLAGN